MSTKLTDILKQGKAEDRVAHRVRDYDWRYGGAARGGQDERKSDYRGFENTYYDLVTDFFEYGWGQSFHFAPRAAQESLPPRSRGTSITWRIGSISNPA